MLSDPELAIAAAEAGSAVVRARYGEPLARIAKSHLDFATEVDLEAEEAILGVLRAARPDDALLGEETGRSGDEGARRTWLVDPLCGTLNYAVRTPLAAVNVALRIDTAIHVAVASDALADEVFWTDGDGAHVRRAGVDEPLAPSTGSRLLDVNLDGPYPNGATFRTVQLLADPEFAERFSPRVTSTSLALAWVAAGRRVGYVTDGDLRDNVHFASGVALCQGAGCVLTDLDGEPVNTGARGLVAAADLETHAILRRIIDKQRSGVSEGGLEPPRPNTGTSTSS